MSLALNSDNFQAFGRTASSEMLIRLEKFDEDIGFILPADVAKKLQARDGEMFTLSVAKDGSLVITREKTQEDLGATSSRVSNPTATP